MSNTTQKRKKSTRRKSLPKKLAVSSDPVSESSEGESNQPTNKHEPATTVKGREEKAHETSERTTNSARAGEDASSKSRSLSPDPREGPFPDLSKPNTTAGHPFAVSPRGSSINKPTRQQCEVLH